MATSKGFEEVVNVLLEHSFRYFGPDSSITRQINDNWNPTIMPEDNSLIQLIDRNLRENNDAYLGFVYIMNYYIFDSFITKLVYELKNPANDKIDSNNLNFKFDEEELRKVMGNIGYLLLKEPTLLSAQRCDYLQLYFQIKKLWSIIITKRYLDDNQFTIEEMKIKIKKSFAIPKLMTIDNARVTIENFLISFDDVYKSRESAIQHVNNFYEEWCKRYFTYIKCGLEPFIKHFCSIINTKFTSVDLIKENLVTLLPTDPFHQLLIEYLSEETNNLQSEADMARFLVLLNDKYNELFPQSEDCNLESNDNPVEATNGDSITTNVEDQLMNNDKDPNLNETSVPQTSLDTNDNEIRNVDDQLLNNNQDPNLNETSVPIETNEETITHADDQLINSDKHLNLNEPSMHELQVPMETEQITDNVAHNSESQTNENFSIGLDDISFTTISTTTPQDDAQTNPVQSKQTEESNSKIENSQQQVTDSLNRSNNSDTRNSNGMKNLTELTRLPINNPTEDVNQISFDDQLFNGEEDDHLIATVNPNYHDTTSSFIKALVSSNNSTPKSSPIKKAKNIISDDSDDLGDLGASIAIKRLESQKPTTSNFLSFDYNPLPVSTSKSRKTTKNFTSDLLRFNISFTFDLLFPNKMTSSEVKADSTITKSIPNKTISSTKVINQSSDDESTDADEDANFTNIITKKTNTKDKETIKENKSKVKSKETKTTKTKSKANNTVSTKESGKRKKSGTLFLHSDSDDDNATVSSSVSTDNRKSKKRLHKDDDQINETNENDEAGKNTIDTVDSEQSCKIVHNQPSIELKLNGKFYHEGKLVSIYN